MPLASDIFLGLALLTLGVWLALITSWGAFWQVWRFDADRETVEPPAVWPSVVAIVPARNEAHTIAGTISCLARQDYPGEFRIIVVDDASDDATAEIARCAAVDLGISRRFEVISAPPLRDGWTGKIWAMDAGVRAAAAHTPDWLWFIDADISLAPNALRRLVSRAARDNLSLASLMVLLEAQTFAERLLVPPFLYFFLMLYPPRWISNPKRSIAGAAGGCLLLRAAALDRIGGCAAIRGEVIDDCALGQAVKRSGGRIWMGLTRASRSIRRYATFAEMRELIARTAFTQLHYSSLELLGTLVSLALIFLLPAALTFSGEPRIWPAALAAWILMSLSIVPTLRFYRVSPLFAPLLPFAALFYAYATALSAVRYWLGYGALWKGRSQAPLRSPLREPAPERHQN
jgi:hopene-associated glycosyltransferase HpnB